MKNENKEDAIIIDIDGTLADNLERRVQFKKNNDWDEFNSNVSKDRLNKWCKEVIDKFRITHKILLVTGRREICRDDTLMWLKKHRVHYDQIFFRGVDDFRKDDNVKEEIFRTYIADKYNILFVIDDRLSVVKMWRNIGQVCLQCDFGDF